MPRADFVTALILVAFATAMLWASLAMPRYQERNIDPLSAPGIVPGFLAVVILILALLLLIRSVRRGGHRLATGDGTARAALVAPATRRMLACLALGLVYAIGLVGAMPFWAATFLFVTVFIVAFEWQLVAPARRWLMLATAALQGALISAAVTLVFQELFLVSLP
jgi:putative tricarboxylic transport membrane protein